MPDHVSAPVPAPALPFTAVVGQSRLKRALILAAVEPRLAGVLISGPRGVAKSTLARGLAAIDRRAAGRFVTLPLGATEEQVVGTLDLASALNGGEVIFKPGLIGRAHGGYLYIDEVNLLADALVDVLLDVAASKTHHVERDGISRTHAAEFVLIGTMNPDEGALRPQLSDRFGLCVELGERLSPTERRAIVDQRLAFEADPTGFVASCEHAEAELAARIETARGHLGTVQTPDAVKDEIARRCHEAAVEGVRADLHWRHAARAHAAWQGKDTVEGEDIEAVADFVLCHRRTSASPSHGNGNSETNADNDDGGAGDAADHGREPPSPPATDTTAGNDAGSDWGHMPPRHVQPAGAYALDTTRLVRTGAPFRATEATPAGRRRGRDSTSQGPVMAGPRGARIDWFQTLSQTARDPGRPREAVYRPRAQRESLLDCVLLDISASTLGQHSQARARAGVLAIAAAAYRTRRHFALLVFGGARIEWLVTPQRAPRDISDRLAACQTGGGTPLGPALAQAERDLASHAAQTPGQPIRSWLVTDGRSRDHIQDIAWPWEMIVVDAETARVRLGRAAGLAATLGARHIDLAHLEAGAS
ncbi:ATP-binding protein [Salinisphaera japonica]|uniref:Magnesium chelatase n=1 Tax=Salinisphaera japonica YTM-1 TaxID=1209778 RepID=A0A423PFG2_9GAMM|nr:ATP-binding protein [Salinisphaera japonica]ROO24347.1 magnesium chelatase [Salinisphaera japonica YTM-1]